MGDRPSAKHTKRNSATLAKPGKAFLRPMEAAFEIRLIPNDPAAPAPPPIYATAPMASPTGCLDELVDDLAADFAAGPGKALIARLGACQVEVRPADLDGVYLRAF